MITQLFLRKIKANNTLLSKKLPANYFFINKLTTFASQSKIMNIRVKYIRGIIISILAFCAASHSAEAITPSKSHSIDSICHILKQSKTPSDSLLLLYHIFDIDTHRKKSEMFDSIYNVAGRAGDTDARHFATETQLPPVERLHSR